MVFFFWARLLDIVIDRSSVILFFVYAILLWRLGWGFNSLWACRFFVRVFLRMFRIGWFFVPLCGVVFLVEGV